MPKKKITYLASFFFISSGILLMSWVLFPIIFFEIYYAPKFGTILRPIPEEIVKKTKSFQFSQVLSASRVDYTKASVWFPRVNPIQMNKTQLTSYFLSIPKLKIEDAVVALGGDDLTKSLIHFTGPLPPNRGNPVILGHSTLLFLYNPKVYKSIFSKLPDLEIGDEIYTTVDQVKYVYKVFEMKITTPEDLSVLNQTYDSQYLTLITCVPQGTYKKRFIVNAKLINLNQ